MEEFFEIYKIFFINFKNFGCCILFWYSNKLRFGEKVKRMCYFFVRIEVWVDFFNGKKDKMWMIILFGKLFILFIFFFIKMNLRKRI